MSKKRQNQTKKQISKHEFYFELPLYESVNSEDLEEDVFSGSVDGYNSFQGYETTYKIGSEQVEKSWSHSVEIYYLTLKCKRNERDKLRFFVLVFDDELHLKVGQFPSLADIQYAEIGKKYDKVLPKADLRDLKKAIGLAAHGAGAGSFVYVRRIFERLVLETFKNNSDKLGVSRDEFKKKHMENKIEILEDHLPNQLVEMKSIYKILGQGVHELSEKQCLKYFSPLKLSIELILDQRIEQEKKRERDAAVKKEIQDIHQELSDKE